MNLLNGLEYSFSLFVSLCVVVAVIKQHRGERGALYNQICLQDGLVILVPSILIGVFVHYELVYAVYLSKIILALILILLFIESGLFVVYRIEINPNTLRWFFSGVKGLGKASTAFAAYFKSRPLYGFFFMLGILSLFQNNLAHEITILILVAYVIAFWRHIFNIFLSSICLIFSLGFIVELSHDSAASELNFIYVAMFILSQFLWFHLSNTEYLAFVQTPTLIKNLFITHAQKLDKSEHLINSIHLNQTKSKRKPLGILKKPNIILITVESLGNYLTEDSSRELLARSRLMKRFARNSWNSKQHFSLCPNTTVSTNQIYTGQYSNNPYNKNDSEFFGSESAAIDTLKKEGYKTLFLDSASTQLFNFHRLLKRIGFDKVWSSEDLHGDEKLEKDYRIVDMVNSVVEEAENKPFFLHLINDQTHLPYEVVDKNTFNRHKNLGEFGEYLNAIEEVDYIIDKFLTLLSQKIDMSNTLTIFTGDHGESFGEFGYKFHSNSVVLSQLEVPFLLHHALFDKTEIQLSCHFDIFPTIFDLIGVEYKDSGFGVSLAPISEENLQENQESRLLFAHSATLRGMAPANFALIEKNKMIWVDRIFKTTRAIDINSRKEIKMTDAEVKEKQQQLTNLLFDLELAKSYE